MNTAKLIFTIPTYYTTLAFLEGTTPRQLLEEFVYYWCEQHPREIVDTPAIASQDAVLTKQ